MMMATFRSNLEELGNAYARGTQSFRCGVGLDEVTVNVDGSLAKLSGMAISKSLGFHPIRIESSSRDFKAYSRLFGGLAERAPPFMRLTKRNVSCLVSRWYGKKCIDEYF